MNTTGAVVNVGKVPVIGVNAEYNIVSGIDVIDTP
jgi:hypothetical protein